jgi:hypothetical protein
VADFCVATINVALVSSLIGAIVGATLELANPEVIIWRIVVLASDVIGTAAGVLSWSEPQGSILGGRKWILRRRAIRS